MSFGYGFGMSRRHRASLGHNGGPPLTPLREIASALASTAYAGAVWDFADKTAAWQDTAGTTPVTSDGQWVARSDDLTGRGQHLLQGSLPSRPQYAPLPNGKPALLFDGADDFLSLASFNLISTNKVVVIAGVRKMSDASIGIVAELSSNAADAPGSFYVLAPGSAGTYSAAHRGASPLVAISRTGYAAPHSALATIMTDLSAPRVALTINGSTSAATGDAGGGNFGDYSLFVGRRAGLSRPLNGALSGLFIADARFLDILPGGQGAIEAAINAGIEAY